ncbi:MAG: sulfatase-like hydrolase/transferase, partial [Verrucomicrobiia bacterium]
MADDMGLSDLGCYGGEIATPNLDRLAQNGLRFTRLYNNNMCTVTRAALLTGTYHTIAFRNQAINPRCATLAETLRAAGYATRMSGKWHLAKIEDRNQWPIQRGFDEFYGTIYGASSFFAPASLKRNNADASKDFEKPGYYYTDAISDNAASMID